MKDRLIQMLQQEGLSRIDLANKLGVQRSNITHIIDGRNKPSYDFIEKFLHAFPNINAEWLILGIEPMYKDNRSNTLFTNNSKNKEESLINEASNLKEDIKPASSLNEQSSSNDSKSKSNQDVSNSKENQNIIEVQKNSSVNNSFSKPFDIPVNINNKEEKIVDRIVILYTDKSFDIYHS